jgi:predicted ArsR family transcriptional regulator
VTKPEGYNTEMEILCILPKEPVYASLRDISHDLGLINQQPVREWLDKLVARGIQVATRNGERGRSAAIRRESWPAAQAMGHDYWHKVYGVTP